MTLSLSALTWHRTMHVPASKIFSATAAGPFYTDGPFRSASIAELLRQLDPPQPHGPAAKSAQAGTYYSADAATFGFTEPGPRSTPPRVHLLFNRANALAQARTVARQLVQRCPAI